MGRLILLNAFPLNAFQIQMSKATVFLVQRVPADHVKELVEWCKQHNIPIECYIRHPATVQVLSRMLNIELKPSSELYNYQQGDVIIVIALRRPIRGQEVENISIDDLDIYRIDVRP